MLLITKRRQIGAIYGQNVYAISKSEMIPLPNSAVRSNMMIDYRNENRLCISLSKCAFICGIYFNIELVVALNVWIGPLFGNTITIACVPYLRI